MGILTSIGQGDRWFENQAKKMGLKIDNIKRLEDGTLIYYGVIDISFTDIEEIPIMFDEVVGNFYCRHCNKLKTLKNAPKVVKGEFSCMNCENLETLKGGPEEVLEGFLCLYCPKLLSLEGLPKVIKGGLFCDSRFTTKYIKRITGKHTNIYNFY